MKNNHAVNNVIGDINSGITMRKKNRLEYAKFIANVCFTSTIEPTSVTEALKGEHWIKAMQETLYQFEQNRVQELIPRPVHVNIIGTKWIFKNKTNKRGNVTQNKARLVA